MKDPGTETEDQDVEIEDQMPGPRSKVQRLRIEVHEFRNKVERPRIKYFSLSYFCSQWHFIQQGLHRYVAN